MSVDPWLFQRLDSAGGAGGTFTSGPWRIVLHTTEIPQADPDNWIPGWSSPSHIVADYERQKIRQCIALDRSGKALENRSGGVETNRLPCIQIELQGRADEAAAWPGAKLAWIATYVLAPVVRWIEQVGGSIDLNDVPEPGVIAMSATVDAPQRFTFARWNSFRGICGHRHVPENEHYDAGGLDMRKLARYAAEVLGSLTPQTSEEDDDMTPEQAQKLAEVHAWLAPAPNGARAWDIVDQNRRYLDPAYITGIPGQASAHIATAHLLNGLAADQAARAAVESLQASGVEVNVEQLATAIGEKLATELATRLAS